MFGITDLYLFIIAGIILNLTPGVDMLYILNNGLQKGFKAGVVATFSISAGCFFHIFLVVIGLSAILKTSVIAFIIVKTLGVVYLAYLGFSLLINSNKKTKKIELESKSLKKIFYKGVLINSLNPKVAVFFLTFLPQFIDINSQEQTYGLSILGLTFILFSTIVNLLILVMALQVSKKFKYADFFTSFIKKAVGILFIGFGVKLAFDL